MTPEEADALLRALKARFEANMHRHPAVPWARVHARLEGHPAAMAALDQMESTGGEPDVIAEDPKATRYDFFDCSPESPPGRRSLCYDQEALDARKEAKPADSAVAMAARMGIELLTEEHYRTLQKHGTFDTKTSSWIATPAEVRRLGGALFCDRRYGRVFVYHNGAQSYYAARGFRGRVRI